MSLDQHYGEQARPWPGGCSCHGQGNGYFSDYRTLFDGYIETVVRTWLDSIGVERRSPYYLFVHDRTDDRGAWVWTVGSFSWTPNGDLFEPWREGLAPNAARAERDGRQAADSWIKEVSGT